MDAQQRAALAQPMVWLAPLVEIAFASETVRLTPLDVQSLDLPDGTSWRGIGAAGRIGALEQPSGEGAPVATLTLSGVDDAIMDAVIASEAEARNRLVQIGVALWSGASADAASFVSRLTLFTGRIDRISYASSAETNADGLVTARRRVVTATVESVFAENRARVKTALYSGVNQRLWFPTDSGLDHMARAADKTVDWPSNVVA